MPSNPIDEILSGMDPIDAATLFAGFRSSVPLAMAAYSGETNAGPQMDFEQRNAASAKQRAFAEPPTEYPEFDRARAVGDFESRFPDPVLRRLVVQEMLKQRSGKSHDPATATRRADFAPESTARHEMRAAPQRYAGGGPVKKTLDQMAAELMAKGVKVETPNMSRRSLFGLKAQPPLDFPLAKIDDKALQEMDKGLRGAPAVTEKTTTVDPGAGKVASTLKSVAATPTSRRTVLKGAASQALQGALPTGLIPDVGEVVKAVAPTAALPSTAQGLMALALSKGMSVDEAIDFVRTMSTRGGKPEPYDIESIARYMKDPTSIEIEGEGLPSSEVLRQMMRHEGEGSVQSLRDPLREIRNVDPDKYKEMMRTARDISEYGFE